MYCAAMTSTAQTQEYRVTPVDEVTLHPDNPRVADVESLRESFQINGFYGAIVVQKSTGFVLAGNHRLQAAVAEGFTELPMIWIDVTDTEAKRILLVDNREADKSGYDDQQLLAVLKSLEEVGLEGTGYDADAVLDLERITGALAASQGDFLRDLTEQYSDADHPLHRDPTKGEEPAAKLTQYFSVSYLFTFEQRAEILAALGDVRERNELETAAAALLFMAREYNRDNGIAFGVPDPVLDGEAADGTEDPA